MPFSPHASRVSALQSLEPCHFVCLSDNLLDAVFQQLFAMGRQPEEATDAELVGMTRKFNWIADSESVEADYAVALRRAYTAYYASREKKS